MKRYLLFDTLYAVGAAVMTVALTCLRIAASVDGYDAGVGYFASGNGYHVAAVALTLCALVAALVSSVLSCVGRVAVGGDPFGARIAAVVTGTVTLFFALTQLVTGISFGHRAGVCLFVAVILLLPGVAYYVLTYLATLHRDLLRAVGAMCLVVFSVFYVFHYYFSFDMPFNGDLKILHIVAVLSMMLFYLSEAKRSLHLPRGIWGRFFATCCFLLACSVGVSELFDFFVDKSATFEDFSHGLLLAVTGLYAFVRLLVERQTVPTAEKTGALASRSETIDAPPEQTDAKEDSAEQNGQT
ncbi:MAG: hypothetical protein J6125_01030 [Clostridia bacterium]|nr:hypothetical protein [Clostridia bacterium]